MNNNRHCQRSLRNRGTGLLAGLILLAVLLSGCGSLGASTPKVYKVGILSGLEFFAVSIDGFKAKMAELGYVEGENIIYDVQRTNFDPALEQAALTKFKADNVDLIFTFPTEASIVAKAATEGTNIPVVFSNASLDGNNLVNSVREPGGNITGVQFPTSDNGVKRFEILLELVPDAKNVWVAYLRDYPTIPALMELLHPAAERAGVTLMEDPAMSAAEVEAALQARADAGETIDAILIAPEPLTASPEVFGVIAKFAAERGIPIGGALLTTDDYGSLFGYTPDSYKVGEQAALLSDKIFKGTPAGTIPVVSADSYLWLNYSMAEELGLPVSEGLLNQATQILR
jgi:putative ABC transport system substrate-binding protein